MKFDTPMIDWGHLPEGHLFGEWDKVPEDPLLILLAHSDCEGKIKHEHAEILANRLEELDNKDVTFRFIKGLRRAAKEGKDVEFY